MRSPYKFAKRNCEICSKSGRTHFLHRCLLEQFLRRSLNSKEVVHHKDHNKRNNSLDNLFLTTTSEHRKLHAEVNTHTCIKEDCVEKHYSKGYCRRHFNKIVLPTYRRNLFKRYQDYANNI